MKIIKKKCSTLKQAERFQNKLYNNHESVRLIGWPRFEEAGIYIWSVSKT